MTLSDFNLTVKELKEASRREELARVCTGKPQLGDRNSLGVSLDYDYGWNQRCSDVYQESEPLELAPPGLLVELAKRFGEFLSEDVEIRATAHKDFDALIPKYTLPALQEHWDKMEKLIAEFQAKHPL